MGKTNQLLGVAGSLASSFLSITNLKFLEYIESLPIDKTNLFEIDLLKGIINPENSLSKPQKIQ